MLSFALVFGFLAAVHCAHVTTVQDVNGLIDQTIVEIRKEKSLKIPDLPNVVITGLEHLKRNGNCMKTAKAGIFECRAVSEEAKVSADGEHEEIIIHMQFEVTVDAEGHLVKYQVVKTDIVVNEDKATTEGFYYKSWLKKTWDKIKHAASEALHAVIDKKVREIVTSIATSILG